MEKNLERKLFFLVILGILVEQVIFNDSKARSTVNGSMNAFATESYLVRPRTRYLAEYYGT
jgi:hypothetical protein